MDPNYVIAKIDEMLAMVEESKKRRVISKLHYNTKRIMLKYNVMWKMR